MSNEILDRMLNNIENVSKTEGTFIYDALSPVSKEIEKVNITINDVLNKVFASTAVENGYSKELELKTSEFGVFRKPGIPSTGNITFTGAEGTVIEVGTLVQTLDNLQFKTTLKSIINEDGNVDVPIESVEVGSKYNVMANTIIDMPVKLIGITSITNVMQLIGGYDVESDTDLYNRFLIKVQTPATSGNIHHYKLWTLEVQGVGDCIIKPLANGPGTVKIIVIDANKRTPSDDIINAVVDHIEENRPIGATIEVIGVTELSINISITLVINSNTAIEDVKNSITENITNYLKNNNERVVRYTRIANSILDAEGVIDYSNLIVNDTTANIELTDEEVAVMGEVVTSA